MGRAWIDGSTIYGPSIEFEEKTLREPGTPYLKLSAGALLPWNPKRDSFIAGDTRVTENIGLLGLHTIFAREHNLWADLIILAAQKKSVTLPTDIVYSLARRIVVAEFQWMTYHDFLGVVLGESEAANILQNLSAEAMATHPFIEFVTVGFRIHSGFPENFKSLHFRLSGSTKKTVPFADIFNGVEMAASEMSITPFLRGNAVQVAKPVSIGFPVELQSQFDLVGIDIQRARDTGIPDYVSMRKALNLSVPKTFEEITGGRQFLADFLKNLYTSIDNIDPLVGALCEPTLEQGAVGELLSTLMKLQFQNSTSDPQFFSRVFPAQVVANFPYFFSSGALLRRNTGYSEIPANAFRGVVR